MSCRHVRGSAERFAARCGFTCLYLLRTARQSKWVCDEFWAIFNTFPLASSVGNGGTGRLPPSRECYGHVPQPTPGLWSLVQFASACRNVRSLLFAATVAKGQEQGKKRRQIRKQVFLEDKKIHCLCGGMRAGSFSGTECRLFDRTGKSFCFFFVFLVFHYCTRMPPRRRTGGVCTGIPLITSLMYKNAAATVTGERMERDAQQNRPRESATEKKTSKQRAIIITLPARWRFWISPILVPPSGEVFEAVRIPAHPFSGRVGRTDQFTGGSICGPPDNCSRPNTFETRCSGPSTGRQQ